MEEYIYDNSNGLWCELNRDYYIPCLTIPSDSHHPIEIWGRKHQSYLKKYHLVAYNELILNGSLHQYLVDIDSQAKIRINILIKQFAEQDGITKQLKKQNQMEWVSSMNNICNRAEEIVNNEIIYI